MALAALPNDAPFCQFVPRALQVAAGVGVMPSGRNCEHSTGVSVNGLNGAISVGDLTAAKCRDISLKTTFSSIKVALHPGTGYTVHARTSFGSINSEVPITMSGSTSRESIAGTINGGGCKLELATANGNVTIE